MDDESSNTSTTTTPEPVPVCCGYRKAPARRLSGEVRYFTDFKKKVNEGGADIGPEMDQLRKERESLTGE